MTNPLLMSFTANGHFGIGLIDAQWPWPGGIIEGKEAKNGLTAIISRNNGVAGPGGTAASNPMGNLQSAVAFVLASDVDDRAHQLIATGQWYTGGGVDQPWGGPRTVNSVAQGDGSTGSAGDHIFWADYNCPRRLVTIKNSNGNVGIGAIATPTFKLHVVSADATKPFFAGGPTTGVRIRTTDTGSSVQGVDSTGVASFQPLDLNGSVVTLSVQGVQKFKIDENGYVIPNLPTSASGLPAGALWNDSGTVKVA